MARPVPVLGNFHASPLTQGGKACGRHITATGSKTTRTHGREFQVGGAASVGPPQVGLHLQTVRHSQPGNRLPALQTRTSIAARWCTAASIYSISVTGRSGPVSASDWGQTAHCQPGHEPVVRCAVQTAPLELMDLRQNERTLALHQEHREVIAMGPGGRLEIRSRRVEV